MKKDANFLAKKFKLIDEQIMVYLWLKEQEINTDDETLCYWSKTYSPKRIKEVVEFANARIASGQQILNMGGFIRKFLRNGDVVVNNICKLNREYALEFIKKKNWSDLKVYEKYVKDSITGYDLPLTIITSDFKYSLEKLYQKSCIYK